MRNVQLPDCTTKRCLRCEHDLPPAAFHNDRRRPDGRFPYCRRCRAPDPEAFEVRQAALAGGLRRCHRCRMYLPPTAFGANRAVHDGLNRLCRPCAVLYATEYVRRNVERVAERVRRHRSKPETKHKRIVWQEARRQRQLAAPATLTHLEWRGIIASQGGRCLMCGVMFGQVVKPTRDHIVPVKLGGALTRDNVQALCGPCNSRKQARVLDLRERAF